MATEQHWCKEHGVPFFKSPKMRSYAHPIAGTEPVEWCNEPKQETAVAGKPVASSPPAPTHPEVSQRSVRDSSIETQVGVKEIGEGIRAGLKLPVELESAYWRWVSDKLGVALTSLPDPPPSLVEEAQKLGGVLLATQEQIALLAKFVRGRQLKGDQIQAYAMKSIGHGFHRPSELTSEEITKLTEAVRE